MVDVSNNNLESALTRLRKRTADAGLYKELRKREYRCVLFEGGCLQALRGYILLSYNLQSSSYSRSRLCIFLLRLVALAICTHLGP